MNPTDERPQDEGSGEARPALDALPQLPGPGQLGGDALWRTLALESIGGPDEVKVRLLRQSSGLVVHITAPTPELAERVVREWFGPDVPYLIELCG